MSEISKLPDVTIAPPAFPAQYEQTCVEFLAGYWADRNYEMYNHFGFTGLLPPDDVRQFLVADTLSIIARAAAGEIDPASDEWSELPDHLQNLIERLFSAPGLPGVYEIPEGFWAEPIGEMVARAQIAVEGDELITVSEAAKIAGVSMAAITNRITAGSLRAYIDPAARNPQKGRRLVRRRDVVS